MNPITLIELLSESYLLLRRLLAMYNTYSKVEDFVEMTDLALNQDLKNHRVVIGEEAFLFLLGRHTLLALNVQRIWDDETVNGLALRSLKTAVEMRTSPDVRSCIVDYATALGQTCQLYDDHFSNKVESYLNTGDGKYVLEDPFHNFIKAQTSAMPGKLSPILTALGMTQHAWQEIHRAIRDEDFSYLWSDPLLSIRATSPHKSQSFMALVLRGAATVLPDAVDEMVVLDSISGNDQFTLNLGLIQRPLPVVYSKEKLPAVRSITSEMVTAMSRRIMTMRGFVQTGPSEWTHHTEATLLPPADNGKGGYEDAKWVRTATFDITKDSLNPNKDRLKDLAMGFGQMALGRVVKALAKAPLKPVPGSRLPDDPNYKPKFTK